MQNYQTSGLSSIAGDRHSGMSSGDTPTSPRSAGGGGSSLGTITKLVNPPPSQASRRLERWALQSASRKILKGERVGICSRRIRPHRSTVKVLHSPSRESFHYGNLMVCGSVWTCPVCASKITEKRRHELADALSLWTSQGGGVLLLTLTVPHYAHQRLSVVLDGISNARKLMLNRKPWKRLKYSLGIVGEIRATEVTWGVNGWHPHFHVLLFTKSVIPSADLGNLEELILTQWQSACTTAELPRPNRHGVTLQDGSEAASYATKWGLEHEMTKGHVKQGREGGLTPFDLLRWYLADKSTKAAALFSEYSKGFKGKKQLHWSSGLRDLLQLGQEATDEELAEVQEEDANLFAEIPLDIWRVILSADRRGEVLEVCRQGLDAFHDYVIELAESAGIIGDS